MDLKASGMVPERPFPPRLSQVNRVKLEIELGIGPVHRFPSRSSSTNSLSEPILTGRGPERRLSLMVTYLSFGSRKRNSGKGPVMFRRWVKESVSRCSSFASDGEIVTERNPTPRTLDPNILSSVTRSLVMQMTPNHEQQSLPFFQLLRIPRGSSVMPALKDKRPASSSG